MATYFNTQDLRVAISADSKWSVYINANNIWERSDNGVMCFKIEVVALPVNVTLPYDPLVFEEIDNE